MSPTYISGVGEYHNRLDCISPASLKGQEEKTALQEPLEEIVEAWEDK